MQNKTAEQILEIARKQLQTASGRVDVPRIQTLAEYGFEKARQGVTTIEEVMRVT